MNNLSPRAAAVVAATLTLLTFVGTAASPAETINPAEVSAPAASSIPPESVQTVQTLPPRAASPEARAGLVFDGLVPVAAGTPHDHGDHDHNPAAPNPDGASGGQAASAPGLTEACTHGFAITLPGETLCTHGPDPAENGRDMTMERTTEEIVASTATLSAGATSGPAIPCIGDGVSGARVQALYVRASDRADRFSSLAPSMAQWATNIDRVFADSAAKKGGVRRVRFVTDPGCNLLVERVVLSPTGDDTFSNTINELKAQGYTRTDRKYLLWTDATVYCGIGTVRGDDRATGNLNEVGPSFARTDSGCWGSVNSVEAHELMHNLGGVQLSAPHSTGGWHCTDESDRMCYADGSGVTMKAVCPSDQERLFDCNNDDYYSVAPAEGSYLATHWNTANSGYLDRADPVFWGNGVVGVSGGTPPTTTTTTTTTAAPTTTTTTPTTTTSTLPPTRTVVFTGSLNRKNPAKVFAFAAPDGVVEATLTFSKAPSLDLALRKSAGGVVASASGKPVALSSTVNAGQYEFEVSGSTSSSFTLTVILPA